MSEEYKNGFEKFSKLKYAFDTFSNGEKILPINRRLYRQLYIGKFKKQFAVEGELYKLFSKKGLCSGVMSTSIKTAFSQKEKARGGFLEKTVVVFMKLLKNCFGIRYYSAFLHFMQTFSRFDSQTFLVNNKK